MADFGLLEDMYGKNYFERKKSVTGNEEKVPIRWMAPESIENDIYTEATDVVRLCIYNEIVSRTLKLKSYMEWLLLTSHSIIPFNFMK